MSSLTLVSADSGTKAGDPENSIFHLRAIQVYYLPPDVASSKYNMQDAMKYKSFCSHRLDTSEMTMVRNNFYSSL